MIRVHCYLVAGRMGRVLLLANWTGVQKSVATLLLDAMIRVLYCYLDGCSEVHCYLAAGRVGRVLYC